MGSNDGPADAGELVGQIFAQTSGTNSHRERDQNRNQGVLDCGSPFLILQKLLNLLHHVHLPSVTGERALIARSDKLREALADSQTGLNGLSVPPIG
jgi:hypothetical protein